MTTLQQQAVTETREALSRASRQVIQALIPTAVVLAAGSTTGIDPGAVTVLAAVTALASLLKSAAGLKLDAGAPLWARIAERAVTAAAGTAAGFVTVDAVAAGTSIAWHTTFTASIGSALVAVGMFFLNPPSVAVPAPKTPTVPSGDGADDLPDGVTYDDTEPPVSEPTTFDPGVARHQR